MFDEDNRAESFRDGEIFYRRPATTIEVRGPGDELIQRIDLPEIALRRSECSPSWLAMLDADERQPAPMTDAALFPIHAGVTST